MLGSVVAGVGVVFLLGGALLTGSPISKPASTSTTAAKVFLAASTSQLDTEEPQLTGIPHPSISPVPSGRAPVYRHRAAAVALAEHDSWRFEIVILGLLVVPFCLSRFRRYLWPELEPLRPVVRRPNGGGSTRGVGAREPIARALRE